MNREESRKQLEEFRQEAEKHNSESFRYTPGLSMFNDKYDTVVAVPVAALASAEEQAQKSPDSE